jgi:membrane protein
VASSAFVIGLRQSINEFFDIVVKYDTKKKKIVQNIVVRLASVLFIGAMTVVIIVLYFAQTVVLNISSSFFSGDGIVSTTLVSVFQHGFAIFGNVVIFTMVFKYVHDGVVKWRLAFRGALLTGTLLYLGQLLIKYYLFNYFFAANGGIAGTFFIILAWVYYSSQIIFYGAKFTAVYAKLIGQPIQFKK